jgi:tetratricopeptide (TPR) repeat protein
LDPDLADGHASLAHVYVTKGWMEKSLEEGKQAIRLNPKDHRALSWLALAYRRLRQIDQALPLANRAVALNPKSWEPYYATGISYFDLGDYKRAEEWARKLLEVVPDDIVGCSLLMWTLMMQDRPDQAEQVSERMISLHPENVETWASSGLFAIWAGDHAKAQRYFENTLKFGPASIGQSVVHSTFLGYVYWKTGKQKQAEEMFAQSLDFNQDRIKAGDQSHFPSMDLAFVYAIQGNNKEACKWLQKAIDAGLSWYYFLLKHPLLENLKDDPQFIQLMAKLKAEIDEMRRRVEAMEERKV